MLKIRAILMSILWTIIILIFPISSGVLVSILKMNNVEILLIQGVFLLISIVIPLTYIKIKNYKFCEFGFRRPEKGSTKRALFFIPLLLIILPLLVVGVSLQNVRYLLALLFFTIAVGISEEIYFRGIIYKLLNNAFNSKIKVILLGSLVFAIGHSASIIGTGDIISTVLQVINAFFFGVVAIEVVIITNSLYPTIILHFLYNFSNYITSASGTTEILCIAIRVAITICTSLIYLMEIYRTNQLGSKKYN